MEKKLEDAKKAKFEDRDWPLNLYKTKHCLPHIEPLPLSLEEYQIFSQILAKLTIAEQNPSLSSLYFEIQRRGTYGNNFPVTVGEEIEKEMWQLGTEIGHHQKK